MWCKYSLVLLTVFAVLSSKVALGQAGKPVVILREMQYVGSDTSEKYKDLKTNMWELLKAGLEGTPTVNFHPITDALESAVGIDKFVSDLRASHIISFTFDTSGEFPILSIEAEAIGKPQTGEFPRSVRMFEARQKNPQEVTEAITAEINDFILGKTERVLFAGCFELDVEFQEITRTRIKRLPRKLAKELRKTSLKNEYKIKSFRSTQEVEIECLNKTNVLHLNELRDYELGGDVSPDLIEVIINRYEEHMDTIESEPSNLERLEEELANTISERLQK